MRRGPARSSRSASWRRPAARRRRATSWGRWTRGRPCRRTCTRWRARSRTCRRGSPPPRRARRRAPASPNRTSGGRCSSATPIGWPGAARPRARRWCWRPGPAPSSARERGPRRRVPGCPRRAGADTPGRSQRPGARRQPCRAGVDRPDRDRRRARLRSPHRPGPGLAPRALRRARARRARAGARPARCRGGPGAGVARVTPTRATTAGSVGSASPGSRSTCRRWCGRRRRVRCRSPT